MRPPKFKWQKTADAFERLFDALESIAIELRGYDPHASSEVVRKLANARKAVKALKEHVNDSEECEMD